MTFGKLHWKKGCDPISPLCYWLKDCTAWFFKKSAPNCVSGAYFFKNCIFEKLYFKNCIIQKLYEKLYFKNCIIQKLYEKLYFKNYIICCFIFIHIMFMYAELFVNGSIWSNKIIKIMCFSSFLYWTFLIFNVCNNMGWDKRKCIFLLVNILYQKC